MNKIYCKDKLNVTSRRSALKSYFHKGSPSTYNNTECTIVQCYYDRNRSVGDLTMLLNSLFKKESVVENIIWLLVDMVNKKECSALYCPNINKVVFYPKRKIDYGFNSEPHSTYTNKETIGIDGYSWNLMLEIYKTKQDERKNK